MKHTIIIAVLLLLSACASVALPSSSPVPPQALTIADREQAEAAWARVLMQHVDDQGRVDFFRWRRGAPTSIAL